MAMPSLSNNFIGIASALGASFFFSFNDMAIKFLSGDYALHQVVLIRSVIGMAVLLAVIVPLEGGFSILRTNRLSMHLMRGMCVVVANMTFFLALAALPLADAVAIFFVSPLVITIFSVIFLKEAVGPRRWIAVAMGLVGVVVMMRPAIGCDISIAQGRNKQCRRVIGISPVHQFFTLSRCLQMFLLWSL